jgi:hypothetical protein
LRSAADLLKGRWADAVFADKAYDSNNLRGKIAAESSVGTNLGSDNDAASNCYPGRHPPLGIALKAIRELYLVIEKYGAA